MRGPRTPAANVTLVMRLKSLPPFSTSMPADDVKRQTKADLRHSHSRLDESSGNSSSPQCDIGSSPSVTESLTTSISPTSCFFVAHRHADYLPPFPSSRIDVGTFDELKLNTPRRCSSLTGCSTSIPGWPGSLHLILPPHCLTDQVHARVLHRLDICQPSVRDSFCEVSDIGQSV